MISHQYITTATFQNAEWFTSVSECPHFHFCLYQNQLMAQHSSRIAWMQHCYQWACCKAAHSDPFVCGQNAGEPGTKRARHCRSVLVQWGIKYAQRELHLHLRLCVQLDTTEIPFACFLHYEQKRVLCHLLYLEGDLPTGKNFQNLRWQTKAHEGRNESILTWSPYGEMGDMWNLGGAVCQLGWTQVRFSCCFIDCHWFLPLILGSVFCEILTENEVYVVMPFFSSD